MGTLSKTSQQESTLEVGVAKAHYVLDANIYIKAYREYYAFDIVESFWKHLIEKGHTGEVVSIDRIKHELHDGDDPLSEWAHKECSHAFTPTDRIDVTDAYGTIMKWAQSSDYTQGAKSEFAQCADGWLLAYAKAVGHTVVTLETPQPLRKGRIKIPDVCKEFGVRCIDTFEMLRELGVKLG